jgi:hypothetical protein
MSITEGDIMNRLDNSTLKALVDEVGNLIEGGYRTFSDGVQIWDAAFIPTALSSIIKIGKLFPTALSEASQYKSEEIGYIFGSLVNRMLKIFAKK